VHLGVANRTLAILPALLFFLVCLRIAAGETSWPARDGRDIRVAGAALVVWAVIASAAPSLLASGLPQAVSTALALALLAVGVAAVGAVVSERTAIRKA
jgi:hypothetical protein